jgi:DNA-directed RNA polymerase III subunit RPC1
MGRLAKLSARSLGDAGFSIGIEDVTPAPRLIAIKASIMAEGDARCSDLISLCKTVRGGMEMG